jgi:hypothetical protein
MLLTMKCTCSKLLDVDDEQFGKTAQCPWCGNRFTAGKPVNSTTAVQAEKPSPRPMEREVERPEVKRDEPPMIYLGKPWFVPPVAWLLIFGTLGCCGLLIGGYLLSAPIGGGESQEEIAISQAKGLLTQACQAYFRKHERFPQNLDELLVKRGVGGPFLESSDALIDPWGNRYRYDPKGHRNNGVRPDIWTVTPSGVVIGNWQKGG